MAGLSCPGDGHARPAGLLLPAHPALGGVQLAAAPALPVHQLQLSARGLGLVPGAGLRSGNPSQYEIRLDPLFCAVHLTLTDSG